MSEYRRKYAPNGSDYVYLHIQVAESALGKSLPVGAQVHHVDGDPKNNAKSNLVICQDVAYHKLLHARARIVRAGGNPNTEQICGTCRQFKPFDQFNRATSQKSGRQRRCRACVKAAWAAEKVGVVIPLPETEVDRKKAAKKAA